MKFRQHVCHYDWEIKTGYNSMYQWLDIQKQN
jgi:hypothetical protein